MERTFPNKEMIAEAQAKYENDKKQLKGYSTKQLLDEIELRVKELETNQQNKKNKRRLK